MGTLAPSTKLQVKHGSKPDESRPFVAHGHAEIHHIGNGSVMRGIFEPGWKWSEDIGPLAGTTSCQAPHLGYVISGRMKVRMDDGTEQEMTPGGLRRLRHSSARRRVARARRRARRFELPREALERPVLSASFCRFAGRSERFAVSAGWLDGSSRKRLNLLL
jgi:hypothetical protein